ncbi:MAG: DUF4129 domain-containing protein [Aggregatilineales bacterium]
MSAIPLAPRTEPIRSRRRNATNGWRTELLFVSMAGIELLWMTPWALIFVPGAVELTGPKVAAFLAAHFLASLILMRVLIRRRAGDGIVRIVFGIGLVLALYITLHYVLPLDSLSSKPPLFAGSNLFFSPALFTIGIVIWLWYRGQSLATATITPARAAFGLRIGIVALIAAGLLPDPRVQRAVLLLLPLFFFDGLAASSLARAATLRVQRDMQRSTFGVGWIGFVGLLSAAISLLGFGAALLLGGTSFDAILGVLGNIVAGVLTLIASLLLPIAQAIASLIDSILTTLTGQHSIFAQLSAGAKSAVQQAGQPNQTLQQVLANAPTACLGLGLLLVFVALLLVLRGQGRRNRRGDEERESLGNSAILAGLRATFQRGLDAARDILDTLSRFGLSGAVNVFTVRRLYRRLVALATERGYPRGESQTPDEYRRLLYEAFPGFAADIDTLTRAYVRAHYGELPDDPGLVATARTALDRMAAQRST